MDPPKRSCNIRSWSMFGAWLYTHDVLRVGKYKLRHNENTEPDLPS